MRAVGPDGVISAETRTLVSRTARGTLLGPMRANLGNRELHRFVLAQLTARPDGLDDVPPEIRAKRLFDNLGVAAIHPRRAYPRRAEEVLREVERCLLLRRRFHGASIAACCHAGNSGTSDVRTLSV